MSDFELTLEAFDTMWGEAEALANAHFAEVDGGVESRRKFNLQLGTMRSLENLGSLIVMCARLKPEGRLIGYFTWQIAEDVESGLLAAWQGAWYVEPGHWGVARAMLHKSIPCLRERGVQIAFPHHRLQGRGQAIGRAFERLGAKPIQITYSLWIGDPNAEH